MKDGPYLLIVLCLVSLMLSVILWVAWKTLGRAAHALTWSLAFALGCAGYLINVVGTVDHASSPLYFFGLGTLTTVINTLVVAGYRQRAGIRVHWKRFAAAIVVTALAVLYYTYVAPNSGARVALIPCFSAVSLFLGAAAVLHGERRPTISELASAFVQIIFGCLEIALVVLALRVGKVLNPRALLLYDQVLITGLPSCYIGNGLISVLLIASDLAARMERLAETDPLTDLRNRRGIERETATAILRARERGQPLAVLLADLDHFKKINDIHGHSIGDLALRRFSDFLTASLEQTNLIGRLGGEEFVFILRDTDETAAKELAETIRAGVPEISLAEFGVAPFTSSFGVTMLSPGDTELVHLLARADVALYHAKATGRNRVCLFEDGMRGVGSGRR